jgi:hypothetical protein
VQSCEVGVVHDALSVKFSQTVGYDTQVVIRKTGNTFVVVFIELSDVLAGDITVHDIVRLILLHQTVTLCLYDIIALVDREIEWSTQFCVYPRLPSFDLEVGGAIAWHQPYDDSRRDKDKAYTDKNIAPLEVNFDIETAHFPTFFY